jgi:flagellar biogenesis protein FliO
MAMVTVALLAGVAGAFADDDPWFQSNVAGPAAEDRALQAEPAAEDRTLRRGVAKKTPEAAATPAPGGPSVSPGWLRTGLSLGGVVALIVVLAYLSRKIPLVYRGRRPGVIEVISRTQLSAKQSLCLVRVGPRMVLIGASGDRLSRLDVIEDPELTAQIAGLARQASPDSSTREFSARLDDEAVRYALGDGQGGETDAVESEPALLAIKERLVGTIRRLKAKRSA